MDPVAQLLFTLYMGIPVIPNGYRARWPHVESPIHYRTTIQRNLCWVQLKLYENIHPLNWQNYFANTYLPYT